MHENKNGIIRLNTTRLKLIHNSNAHLSLIENRKQNQKKKWQNSKNNVNLSISKFLLKQKIFEICPRINC